MRLLDRYVLTRFLVPFFYCFFGFLAIWLVFDLRENGSDFLDAKVSFWRICYFYATQLPQIVVISLPVGLLLSLLYALSKMSRGNEIIAMLTAGCSLTRLLVPLFACGLVATAGSMALNYKMAPQSEAIKKMLMDQWTKGRDKTSMLLAQVFRNRSDYRTWYARNISLKRQQIQSVHVIQQDAESRMRAKYFATRADFDPDTHTWTLVDGYVTNFDEEGRIKGQELFLHGRRTIQDWSETPWRIASASMDPKTLSVGELRNYLAKNSDFPDVLLAPYWTHLYYRFAVPWACFIVVFIAAPLGIVYSRRGVLAGVTSSIFIMFGYICLKELFLAFGEGGTIPPMLAAWGPNLFFLTVGLYLLHLRANNRELPTFATMFARKRA